MSKPWLSLKALQAQSRVWPQIIHRAPATSALRHCYNTHSLTSSRHGPRQKCTQHPNSNKTLRDGWEWQPHSLMLFLSFEIAIKTDLIKPGCIIEVFRETLTGSRYSLFLCKDFTRSIENCGIRGSHDGDSCWRWKPDVSHPVCPEVLWMLIGNNYACFWALCAHSFKTVIFVIVQVCTCLFKLWLGIWWMCIVFLI